MNFELTKNHRILIIEDDLNLNHLLENILVKMNYKVSYEVTLRGAKENLERCRFAYDLILLDYHMPDGKGSQFIKWIKSVKPKIPVIFISADNNNNIVLECFKAGALDYIVKPFDIKNILSVIDITLNSKATSNAESNDINAEVFTADWIELSASSQVEYLGRIQKLSTTLLRSKLAENIVDDIRLAMEEYGRNAIEWGNKFDKNKIFKISYCIFEDRVILKFEDEGEGFDLKSIPDPSIDPIKHLKSREDAGKRPGGYGIFMMKQIMDEIIYNDKGNACIMTKFIK